MRLQRYARQVVGWETCCANVVEGIMDWRGKLTRSSSFAFTDSALAMSATTPRRSETLSERPLCGQMQSRGYKGSRRPRVDCLRAIKRLSKCSRFLRAWVVFRRRVSLDRLEAVWRNDETRVGPFLLKNTDATSNELGDAAASNGRSNTQGGQSSNSGGMQ
jgi:hypothetical protein